MLKLHEQYSQRIHRFLHYIKSHFEAYPMKFWTPLVRLVIGSLPRRLQEKALAISGSGVLAFATKAATSS